MQKDAQVDRLAAMRHSLAHILATAMQELYPGVKFGVGPVIEDGFYYDFDLGKSLAPEDLILIEAKMREIVKAKQPFEHQEMGIEDAIERFTKAKQPYKVELLNDLKQHGTTVMKEIESGQAASGNDAKITTVTLYSNGPFTDLCRGGHLENTGEVGAFKLTHAAGAYWRGSEKNPMLQRVYGVAFETQQELDEYLARLEEAKKRDHRVLGQALDLFTFSDLVGAGLPLFTPRGTVMINEMMRFVREINAGDDYIEVRTGHVTKEDLYERSGHLAKFGEDLFKVQSGEDRLALKPMNCPHHTQMYGRTVHSYRELPIRYAEFSTLHRNEVKGVLGGLTRVRALTQDDAHAFVRADQIEVEITTVIGQIDRLMKTYNLDYHVRISLRDPQNMKTYLGDAKIWDRAESILCEVTSKLKLKTAEAEGEAAFYGPKLDLMAVDAIGRQWQVGTVQLDFNMPERFDLEYIDEDGQKQRPVMIHRALNGTFERMLGILIEHFAGAFPTWLAPEQVRLAGVNDTETVAQFTTKLKDQLEAAGIRVGLDLSNESVGKKIREAEMMKVPYTVVVGQKEIDSGEVTPRVRRDRGSESGTIKTSEFVAKVAEEAKSRSLKSLL